MRVERRTALLALALAGTLLAVTGAVMVLMDFHEGPRAFTLGVEELRAEIVRGMVMRNLHRLGTRMMAVVAALHATFLFVRRLSAKGVLQGARRARVAVLSLGVALAAILAAVTFVPWDSVATWMATIGTEPPRWSAVGDGEYDVRELLGAGVQAGALIRRRIWILHGVVSVLGAALLLLHVRWGKRAA